jgi:hypothetical protein
MELNNGRVITFIRAGCLRVPKGQIRTGPHPGATMTDFTVLRIEGPYHNNVLLTPGTSGGRDFILPFLPRAI